MLLLNNKSDKKKLDQLRVINHQKYQYIYMHTNGFCLRKNHLYKIRLNVNTISLLSPFI